MKMEYFEPVHKYYYKVEADDCYYCASHDDYYIVNESTNPEHLEKNINIKELDISNKLVEEFILKFLRSVFLLIVLH